MDDDLSAMTAVLLFFFGLFSLLLTVNALRRPSPPRNRLPAMWLPAMLTSELAPVVVVARVTVALAGVAVGGLETRRGRFGVWMIAASVVLMIPIFVRRFQAVRQAGPDGPLPAMSFRERWLWRIDLPADIELETGIVYHDGLTLDVYRSRTRTAARTPAFVYVHGGSWTGGDPHRHSRALFHHLVASGWSVVTIRYPLSPQATFPDHAIGVKRAIAWLKTEGPARLGIDPNRLVLSGASAGAHLAALAALVGSELQPGFEEIDTSVAACVPFYGIYDFLIRHDTRIDWPLIPQRVMKTTATESPDLYRLASPIDQVSGSAPPFLVVHGTHDSLVPPREAEVFVAALSEASASTVEYYPVIGAQHGFDAISSPRTRAVGRRVTNFLHTVVPISDRVP